MTKPKHPNQTSVSTWLDNDLLARLDRHIAASCRGIPGAKPSRQAWITEAIRTALSNAECPTLAAMRGRLADAEAPRLDEVAS
jgi:hypothetical protein